MRKHPLYVADGPPTLFEVDRPQVTNPEQGYELLREMEEFDREVCMVLLLDTKHRLLEKKMISMGSVDHTFMSPREIMRDAVLANASAIVLGHNHPSGEPEPSRDDELVTRRIVSAAEVIGIELLDHLVIGERSFVSMARRGLI